MKKIILSLLIVVMVIVLGVGLTACNSAKPEGQLSNLLSTHNHETFTYSIRVRDVKNDTYSSDPNSYYVARLDAFKKGTPVPFGSRTLSDVSDGVRVTGELVYGKTIYEMGCYYTLVSSTSYMVPAYSFLTVTEDGTKTYEMQGKYNGSTFECDRVFGERTQQDSVKLSGTFFDNNQFQQILRALPASTFSGGMNLTFSTPIANAYEFASASLTAKGNSTEAIKVPYTDASDQLNESGINCYRISLSRTTDVSGLSHTLYYAVDEVKCNGWGMKNILVKIVEPFDDENKQPFEMHYELKSVELE